MQFKIAVRDFMKKVAFAFYPGTTLLLCLAATVLVDVSLGIWASNMEPASTTHAVLIAIITGASASFFVSLVVELSNNYKNNRMANYELSEYFTGIMEYEAMKQVLMVQTGTQRAEIKAMEECKAGGGKIDADDEREPPLDAVQVVWVQLSKIMPLLEDTYKNKKVFLMDKEIIALRDACSFYAQIKSVIQMELQDQYLDKIMNAPEEAFLNRWLPQNLIDDSPPWFVKALARNDALAALDTLIDRVMETGEYQYIMWRYPVSEQYALKMTDDGEASKEESETRAEGAFTSIALSYFCKEIAGALDKLEDAIIVRPYIGWVLAEHRNSPNRSLQGDVPNWIYERTKKRLHEQDTDGSEPNKAEISGR